MHMPGPLIAGAASWCFVFSSPQFLKFDLRFTSRVFSSHSPLSPTFSLPPGWRTGNALDAVRRFSEQHFIAAFYSAGAVSTVTFPNGACRRPEILFLDPSFPPGGRQLISEIISDVAKANGEKCGVDDVDAVEDGGDSDACAWAFGRFALWQVKEGAGKT